MQVIRQLPDAEIIYNLRQNKQVDETIRSIYRDCFDSLAWYVMNNNGNKEDAEDLFQETIINFIALVQKDRFRGESGIRTFLFSINRHLWLNELKRRSRSLAREEKFEKEQDRISPDITQALVERESHAQLIELVEQLGDSCKKILLLFYYENMSIKEILEKLPYENEQVVRNKKYKCLKQLEQMMNSNPAIKQILQNLLHE